MSYLAPTDEMKFLLRDLFSICDKSDSGKNLNFDDETVDSILDEVSRLTEHVISPINRDGDLNPAIFEGGKVTLPPSFSMAYDAIAKGGWVGISGQPKYGGLGLPMVLTTCVNEILSSGCLSLGLNPLMTQGQIAALENHASEEIKKLFLPRLNSGEWSGTMNLTEPQAGSDVGALSSKAKPGGDGLYRITGQKIYISWGDHCLSSNICHLVLARLSGSSEGTKGISLFLVPKYIPNNSGEPMSQNNVKTISLEKKMGLHGSPTAVLEYDNAKAWLIGQENKGMAAMFTMMNNARLGVAVQGLSQSELATQKAFNYAKERKQGKNLKFFEHGSTVIINHADVRRNLLIMKSLTFVSRALCFDAAISSDLAKFNNDSDFSQRASFLTPIAKVFCTDAGCRVTDLCLQVHGGLGYIEASGISQLYRDVRVTAIYEGTNGIQAMDLVGRKLGADGNIAYSIIKEIMINENMAVDRFPELVELVSMVRKNVTKSLDWMISQDDLNERFSGAGSFLSAFALLLGANYMLRSILVSNDVKKKELAEFFICQILPSASVEASISCQGSNQLYQSPGIFTEDF
ncbi:MAG: acyl-CoA dehydrogenase family protein [Paracoccaceae bacterium]|nr:acyl-CoA dehydrogenase family protein [Paracoccaceae bacterium]